MSSSPGRGASDPCFATHNKERTQAEKHCARVCRDMSAQTRTCTTLVALLTLSAGGTGFAAHDKERTQAAKHWTLGPGSGRQELRGQHRGTRSAFGLSFNN